MVKFNGFINNVPVSSKLKKLLAHQYTRMASPTAPFATEKSTSTVTSYTLGATRSAISASNPARNIINFGSTSSTARS
jgi:hypothetical protein